MFFILNMMRTCHLICERQQQILCKFYARAGLLSTYIILCPLFLLNLAGVPPVFTEGMVEEHQHAKGNSGAFQCYITWSNIMRTCHLNSRALPEGSDAVAVKVNTSPTSSMGLVLSS